LLNIPASSFIWGYSYAKISKTEDIHFYVDAATELSATKTESFNVPHICVDSLFGTAGNW